MSMAKTTTNTNDAVSRSAAIDAIKQYGSVWIEYTDDMTPEKIAINALKATKQAMVDILSDLQSEQCNYERTPADDCDMQGDLISRQAAIECVTTGAKPTTIRGRIAELPSARPDQEKYEYHYDHTDCIWFRPEARNRCPSTCAQYRDGWNDAMNYIFRDGAGYRPYRRDQKYE